MNVCQCGIQAGYLHAVACPYLYYGNATAEIARWLAARLVECSQCGRVGSESVACWNMADPVCPECWGAS